jgi:phage terminase large subunit-like protein
MLEWAISKDDNWTDFETVKLANPASWVTVDSLVDAFESLRPNVFKRYRCNLWTLAFESWLPEGAWEALRGDSVPVVEHRLWNGASNAELDAYIASLYPEGSLVVGAVDMARYRDCAAITLVGPSPNGLVLPRAVIWRSGGTDNPIPYEPVYRAARQLCATYAVQALGLDQKYLDEMYDTLDAEGLPVESYPQSNERLCPADANLRNAIVTERAFEHDGDPFLAAHVNAGVALEVGASGFKLGKSKSNGPPIDAARALSMAFDLAGDDLEPAVPLVDWGDA